jgi:uncharacterized protein YjbI with pentapeptide repeats
LDNVDLSDADLREAELDGAKWTHSKIRGAMLDAVQLNKAVMRLCNLDNASLTKACLQCARIEDCAARGAQFDGVDMNRAVLTDTDFSRATFVSASLENISASGACFRGADLRDANLRNADLSDTDLRGADFTGADLEGAVLTGADLRGVVGDHPALLGGHGPASILPPELQALTETMAPIIGEVFRTAGEKGAIDHATAERLMAEAAAYGGDTSRNAPSPEALTAVTRVLEGLGDEVLPALFGALQQSKGSEPPAAIKNMILRLRDALGLEETATAEDVLARLLSRNRV